MWPWPYEWLFGHFSTFSTLNTVGGEGLQWIEGGALQVRGIVLAEDGEKAHMTVPRSIISGLGTNCDLEAI
jgi:hypothetical protein